MQRNVETMVIIYRQWNNKLKQQNWTENFASRQNIFVKNKLAQKASTHASFMVAYDIDTQQNI